jgi:rhodanese-related sulfurtransferase
MISVAASVKEFPMPDWLKIDDLLISLSAAAVVVFGARQIPRLLAGVPFVTPAVVHQKISDGADVLVLDVREPAEFTDALGHIKGAVNIPLGQVADRLSKNSAALKDYADTPIYVVCRSANRAASAARVLKKAGLTQIAVMSGGMMRWNRDSLPTIR